MEIITRSPFQTRKEGEKLAKEILKAESKKKAFVIGLVGELGGGKTTFLQGFARGLGIKEKILSPTFTILKRFKIKNRCSSKKRRDPDHIRMGCGLKFKNFYHIDCYRLKKPKEILTLNFQEIISNPENIVAIEWANKIKKILPKKTIFLNFDFIDQKTRQIKIIYGEKR